MGSVPHVLVVGVLRIGMGGVTGVVHVAMAVGGHVLMTGVRRTITRLPTSRHPVVVALPSGAVIALPPAAVIGVLTAAVWRLVVAGVAVRVVRRPSAGRIFVDLPRGGGVRSVVGLRLMGRPGVLSVATTGLRGRVGDIVFGGVVWSVLCVGVLGPRMGVAGRSLVG
ncbi:hypothetical protein [Micromonospora chersina]|nr:hypothetical protein [Micromonospora chersina]